MIETDDDGLAVGNLGGALLVGGALLGLQRQPRDIAEFGYAAGPKWRDAKRLTEMVQVTLAESQGFDHAYNDNHASIGFVPASITKVRNAETYELYVIVSRAEAGVTVKAEDGSTVVLPNEALVIVTRDVGIMEINIPAEDIGTAAEAPLWDVETNLARAYALYDARGWQPWVAWNTRVCFRDTYVKRAARGVANFLAHDALAQPADEAALPRYLKDPAYDYTYRLGGALHYLGAVKAGLADMAPHVDTENQQRIRDLQKLVAAGAAFKTADHPWDYEAA